MSSYEQTAQAVRYSESVHSPHYMFNWILLQLVLRLSLNETFIQVVFC